MQKKRLLSALLLLNVFLVGAINVTGAGNIVEEGDTVLVDYTATYLDTGEIFETTNETLAKEENIFDPLRLYEPVEIIVGLPDANPPAFHDALIGLRLGERDRNIHIKAEDWTPGTTSDVLLDIFIVSINGVHYSSSGGIGLQQILENPIVGLGLLVAGVAVVIFLGYRLSLTLGEKYENIKLGRCEFCGKPAIGRCGNPKCNKGVCRTCFQNGCPACRTNKLAPKRV
ncbi:MAG: hypothetical protein ACFFBD_06765 [Candidatus Hodarchaeota archaeon]